MKWNKGACIRLMLPCPGGVIVMVCAVNSSSKYRVSVSEVTWGLNGGTSCWSRAHKETYQYCPTVVLLMTICKVFWKASYTVKHPAWAPGWRNVSEPTSLQLKLRINKGSSFTSTFNHQCLHSLKKRPMFVETSWYLRSKCFYMAEIENYTCDSLH